MTDSENDLLFMRRALELAQQGAEAAEVPVGAVVVRDLQIIGEGFNQVVSTQDPTAHAECVALRDAASRSANYRLPGCTLYVSLEPCTMCVGALVHARIARLVFATPEPRAGVVCSRANALAADYYNHRVDWQEGPLGAESAALLQAFFQARR
jgi:tRNA(adenine34) deaminase